MLSEIPQGNSPVLGTVVCLLPPCVIEAPLGLTGRCEGLLVEGCVHVPLVGEGGDAAPVFPCVLSLRRRPWPLHLSLALLTREGVRSG